ncbi:protein ELF4-LIKE 1 [Citrus sinensis]|uniref:Protein ELF4-LIKE 1 n=1 Tax=Citrus sinensis TaxID=2711 RepID=A0ACB8IX50_CITSI|nr:protein ELF4-LIKE 1 [Citrus sinensis]
MDDTTSTTDTKPDNKTLTVNTNERSKVNNKKGGGRDDDSDEEEYDAEAWNTLSKSFKQVQTVLDNNRSLIERVNENHLSRIPDNMSKNVELIREINGNISKVVSIYSDLSANFCNIVSQRRRRMRMRMNNGHRRRAQRIRREKMAFGLCGEVLIVAGIGAHDLIIAVEDGGNGSCNWQLWWHNDFLTAETKLLIMVVSDVVLLRDAADENMSVFV